MASKHRVIVDTDPGVDDTLALLLALSADPEQLQVDLISVTYGNVEVQNCTRNVISIFHHVAQEIEFRKRTGRSAGFPMLERMKPIVAVGAEAPLADQQMMADYFHGRDGLGGIYESHPHLEPADTWTSLFSLDTESAKADGTSMALAEQTKTGRGDALFIPSKLPAHRCILELLRENEVDTFTIVAVGPLTNLALAAAEDAETFLRVKEVLVMGGAIDFPGNITPVAEFNTYADSIAAARVYALTSPFPSVTMPPVPPSPAGQTSAGPPPRPPLSPYPSPLSRQLKLTLFPLDITTSHVLHRRTFRSLLDGHAALLSDSPLSAFLAAFLESTFAKMTSLYSGLDGDAVFLSLHDPLCIWYLLNTPASPAPTPAPAALAGNPYAFTFTRSEPRDLRVETAAQWTRGMCVVDRREDRRKLAGAGEAPPADALGDAGCWLDERAGNRIRVVVGSAGKERFGEEMVRRILGL